MMWDEFATSLELALDGFDGGEWVLYPAVYRGVPVPDRFRIAIGQSKADAALWRAGVDAALNEGPAR